MRLLYTFIFSLLLIIGCKNNSGTDSLYPMQIGSFYLPSPAEANWIGNESGKAKLKGLSQTKAVGDSLILDSPDGAFLQFVHVGVSDLLGEQRIELTYIDSTITEETVRQDSIDITYSQVYIKGIKPGDFPFRINRRIPSIDENAMTIFMEFLYTCNQPIDGSDEIVIDFYKPTDNLEEYYSKLVRTKVLQTEGIQAVFDDIFCEEDPTDTTS